MKKTLLALTLLSVGFGANAALIKVKEDGLNAVYDTTHDITWLELGYGTASMQSMLNKMVVGGQLEGWSFANRNQLNSLWGNGQRYVYDRFYKVAGGSYVAGRWYDDRVDDIKFIGSRSGSAWYDKTGYDGANQYGWWIVKGEGSILSQDSTQYAMPENYVDPAHVPLTGALGLMALGLVGLRRKKK